MEKQTRRLSTKEKQISKIAKQKIPLLEQPLEEPESEMKIKKPTRNLTLLLEEEVLSLWQESLDWKEASPGMIQSFRSRLDAHQMTSSTESHEDNDFRRIQEPPTPISPGGDHPHPILPNIGQARIALELSGTSLSNPITIK